MRDNIIEAQRKCHELNDRLTEAAVKEILHPKTCKRDHINSDFRMKKLIERARENRIELQKLYDDVDGERKEEINTLSTENDFYNNLRLIKDYHRKDPGQISIPMCTEFEKMDCSRNSADELVSFSGEEGYGKFLDLNECYNSFINLKCVTKVGYLKYLQNFDDFTEISKDEKLKESYRKYLTCLLSYLENFVGRAKPLFSMAQHNATTALLYERDWTEGICPGWPKETSGALAHTGAYLDLNVFSSWEELASLGLDRLKSALMALNLKNGGSLEERAKRLYSCKGKNIDEIDKSLLVKSKSNKEKLTIMSKEIAFFEAKIHRLTELLEEERKATGENIQRKQASNTEERISDEADEQEEEGEEEEEETNDPKKLNPKNLPVNADGSVMAYWHYKFLELDKKFKCEICGNHTYVGPYEYQKHFSESRHAHGMRVLQIPNTAHFHNITFIEDAITQWQKLKTTKEFDNWNDEEEEFEDSKGNVVTKKTYNDMRKQGLL